MAHPPSSLADLQELGVAYAQRYPSYDDRANAALGFPAEPGEFDAAGVVRKLTWTHLPVNFEYGTRLFANDRPFKARHINVWASDVTWSFSRESLHAVITSAAGHRERADSAWRYPTMYKFGIVLWQPNGIVLPVPNFIGADNEPYEFQISIENEIILNVNDAIGTYQDNGGAFSLILQVLEP